MSILSFHGRPWTVFNAADRDHRKWFAQFQAQSTWANCPVRFVIDSDQGDLITMIQRRLIDYYTTKEFGQRTKNSVKKQVVKRA
jgi:hypothetical protein